MTEGIFLVIIRTPTQLQRVLILHHFLLTNLSAQNRAYSTLLYIQDFENKSFNMSAILYLYRTPRKAANFGRNEFPESENVSLDIEIVIM